ncbi:MAG: DNA-3-methyladenine glycosylase [Halanaeroarchaeum sp.]
METGAIPRSAIAGPFDLQATLESGQTFRWTREEGRTYLDPAPRGGEQWYRVVLDDGPVAVRQTEAAIEWRATGDATDALRRRLRLDEEMAAAVDALPDDPLPRAAASAFPGLHVVSEPFFPTLVSFILSAQMRVERIHDLVGRLSDRYGRAHEFDGETVHAYPTPEQLAAATESELREMGLGYRAPYVVETTRMVADGDLGREDVAGMGYEDARSRLTEFVGVGEKVADCVLLFSFEATEPVPLDTWIRRAIDEHYPEVEQSNYDETSRDIRARLGPEPGVAQTYVFHYLRHREHLAESPAD